jgi:hypothetical protein
MKSPQLHRPNKGFEKPLYEAKPTKRLNKPLYLWLLPLRKTVSQKFILHLNKQYHHHWFAVPRPF